MNDLVTRPIEVTPDIIDSRYRLVIAAAKRARQLMEGAPVRVEKRYLKETTTALQEIVEKRFRSSPEKKLSGSRPGAGKSSASVPVWKSGFPIPADMPSIPRMSSMRMS